MSKENKELTVEEVKQFLLDSMTEAMVDGSTFTLNMLEPVPELGNRIVPPLLLAKAIGELGKDQIITARMPSNCPIKVDESTCTTCGAVCEEVSCEEDCDDS